MSIVHNPKGPASTLSINLVQVLDEDNYVCETTFLEPMEKCENSGSFSIGLLVYGKPIYKYNMYININMFTFSKQFVQPPSKYWTHQHCQFQIPPY